MSRSPVHTAYGIDVADGRVTIVRAEKKTAGIVYTPMADGLDCPTDAKLPPILEEINEATGRGKAFAAVGCPDQDSFIRVIEAPFPSVKKAVAVFPSLLDIQLPFPLEQCVYGFARIHKAEDGCAKAVAAGVPADRLQQQLDDLSGSGIDPEWVEQEAMALWRFSEKTADASSQRPRVIFHLDRSRTVVVIGNHGLPVSSFSMKKPWSPTADAASVDKFVVRLKQQIAGALGAANSVPPLFVVCGPVAGEQTDSLRESLGVDTACWQVADDAGNYLARALANGVLEPNAWSFNLRFGDREHAHVARLEKNARKRMIAGLAIGLACVVGTSLVSVSVVKHHHDQLQETLQEQARVLTGIPAVPRGQEVFVSQQHVNAMREKHDVFNNWFEPTAYPLFKEMLESAQGLAATIDTVAIRSASLVLKGTCSDWKHPDVLAELCRERGWQADVEREDAGVDERVHFTLRAQP